MDNSYILLLILKKEINVYNFLKWYQFESDCVDSPTFDDYYKHGFNCNDLSKFRLEEFEYNYFVSYLHLRGIINGRKI